MGNVSTKRGHKHLEEEADVSISPQNNMENTENANDADGNVPSFDPSLYDNHQDQVPSGNDNASVKSQRGYHVTPDYSYVNLSESSDDSSEHVSPSSDNKHKANIYCQTGANKQDQDCQSISDSSSDEESVGSPLQFKMDKELKSARDEEGNKKMDKMECQAGVNNKSKNAQVFQKNHGNARSKTQEKQVPKENVPGQ